MPNATRRTRRHMRPRRRDGAAPTLLPTFFAATIAMVGAVVAIARIDSDWADLAALVLLGAVLGLLLMGLRRRLDEEEPDPPAGER